MANPLEQFTIKPLIHLELFGYDISFTNASLIMLVATFSIITFFALTLKNPTIIPSKKQMIGEGFYLLITNMLDENVGQKGRKFIPLIFTIFIFILFCNLFGMIPYSFTATSHLAVTLIMAMIIFFTVVIIGFIHQGAGFLSIFVPEGVPLWLAPLIVVIELFAFLARPISLSLRLAANMIAGHVMLKVLAGFIITLPFILKVLPIPLITLLIGFEIFVSVLQAYIFAILSCVYLSDAVNAH